MHSILVDHVTYQLPATEAEVLAIVNRARAENGTVALRGSGHSFPLVGSLETDPAPGCSCQHVLLSYLAAVDLDAATGLVTVQGGCHLGYDPYDPTGISTEENSLCYQLDQQGWALPDLGGITHQTVGGFLATGSAGGSTKFSFDEQLVEIILVTAGAGGAELLTFRRPADGNPADPFFAVGVSLGLFGIIVSATFQCVPRFAVQGAETTSAVADCAIDLFGPGSAMQPSLAAYFARTDYARLMWWPQAGVEKMVVWEAWQVPMPTPFIATPYQEVPWIFNSPLPVSWVADGVFTLINSLPDWVHQHYGPFIYGLFLRFGEKVLPQLLNLFVTANTPEKPPQVFRDVWYRGIPMDNQMDDRLMGVWFTELWIPLAEAGAVMRKLRDFYVGGLAHTGTFSCEIYAGRASKFWLSPAFGADVVRIDVFWFAKAPGRPDDTFYPQFWNLLQEFNFRPHWGKFLPKVDGPQGPAYLRARYPNFAAWLALRARLDPQQVFVGPYWRQHLGIAPVGVAASTLAQ